QEIKSRVLAATDIVELIGSALELKPSGAGRFKALCPFHHEKTPSFNVSRDRQTFYCFGCQKGGDAINWVMEHDALPFPDAMRKLADRAGVELPAPSERDGKEDFLRRQLIELGSFAAGFYTDLLKDPMKGSKARSYLKTRQLKDETTKRFGIGFAPEGWSNLLDAARAKGFRDAALDASGLVKRGERGSYYDTFRDRLMVPIRDVSGNVVAFGGRDLGGESQAKYINSPETVIYKKSRVLYGLFEAREALRHEKRAILVEGYFDLMRCFDAGIQNVIASCGTALTTEQANLIRRYVPEVVIVYDGDPAGVNAALRATAILTAAGLTVRALALPDGKDPDDFIRDNGAEAFHNLVIAAPDFVTFYVRMNESRLGTIEGRTDVAKEVFTIVQSLDDAMRTDEYLKRLARELQLDEWSVRREYQNQLKRRDATSSIEKQPAKSQTKFTLDDTDFISALLSGDQLRDRVRQELTGKTLKPSPFAEVLIAVLDAGNGDVLGRVESEDGERLYAAASNRHVDPETGLEIVEKRLTSLQREALLDEDAAVVEQMRDAKRRGDIATETQLVTRRVSIRREIDRLAPA
ncbi:MAG: DNA primase, partial [Candidatus Hydrogenedentes bacterium]|nr:DNA primase [Candidatus Hydrogenedentota bacterium]